MVVKMQEALMSIGVKKGLPYTKFLNRELSKLRGSGVLQNILNRQKTPANLSTITTNPADQTTGQLADN